MNRRKYLASLGLVGVGGYATYNKTGGNGGNVSSGIVNVRCMSIKINLSYDITL